MKFKSILFMAALPFAAHAEAPSIEDVETRQSGDDWRFDVTILHPDSGWDHYADGWQVLAPDGTQLGYRELAHPHVNEQPFTRSLSGITIPDGIKTVSVQARCNVDGWANEMVQVQLER